MVSILVPAHNEEETLAQVVESIAKITYQKIELVLINDGSHDNTLAVMDSLKKGITSNFQLKLSILGSTREKPTR